MKYYEIARKKRTGRTEYKFVWKTTDKEKPFDAVLPRFLFAKSFCNARAAAIAIDQKLIEHGQQPINVLRKLL